MNPSLLPGERRREEERGGEKPCQPCSQYAHPEVEGRAGRSTPLCWAVGRIQNIEAEGERPFDSGVQAGLAG